MAVEHISVKKLNTSPVSIDPSTLYFIKHTNGDLEIQLSDINGEVLYKSITKSDIDSAIANQDLASTSQYGLAKLYDDIDSDATDLAATARVVKSIYNQLRSIESLVALTALDITNESMNTKVLEVKLANTLDGIEKMKMMTLFSLV